MDLIQKINPTFVEHEGFFYLEYNGEFFKGCKRCGGEGHYSHNGDHSRCYECDNTSAKLGEQLASREAAEKWCHVRALAKANRERKAEEKRMAAVRAQEANAEALKLAAPDVFEFLMNVVIEDDNQADFANYEEWAAQYNQGKSKIEKNSFIRSMAECLRWVGPSRPFSEKMIAGVRHVMAQLAERAAVDAARPAVPTEGRQKITGTILSTKIVEGDYGTAYKIVVEDDRGFKVYGSLPKAQAEEAYDAFIVQIEADGYDWRTFGSGVWFLGTEADDRYNGVKGRRIQFDAAITASNDDKSFGFASRPTKGQWL